MLCRGHRSGSRGRDHTSSEAHRFTLQLPAELASARTARGHLSALLSPAHASPRLLGDAELVLHELVINAVVHGHGEVSVVCVLEDGCLVISVHDTGSDGRVAVRPLTDDQPSGRGLAMVAALSESWEVDRSAGTTVSARLRR